MSHSPVVNVLHIMSVTYKQIKKSVKVSEYISNVCNVFVCVCVSAPGEGWISTVIHLANVPTSLDPYSSARNSHRALGKSNSEGRGEGTNVRTIHFRFWVLATVPYI